MNTRVSQAVHLAAEWRKIIMVWKFAHISQMIYLPISPFSTSLFGQV